MKWYVHVVDGESDFVLTLNDIIFLHVAYFIQYEISPDIKQTLIRKKSKSLTKIS